MTDAQIAFESKDCTFVLYEDGSWDAYDDEGQRIFGGAFTKLDILELSEHYPPCRGTDPLGSQTTAQENSNGPRIRYLHLHLLQRRMAHMERGAPMRTPAQGTGQGMTEKYVQVPVWLIESAADALTLVGDMAASNELRALLSQPPVSLPTREQIESMVAVSIDPSTIRDVTPPKAAA